MQYDIAQLSKLDPLEFSLQVSLARTHTLRLNAVSYTHLDVYKRQLNRRSSRTIWLIDCTLSSVFEAEDRPGPSP